MPYPRKLAIAWLVAALVVTAVAITHRTENTADREIVAPAQLPHISPTPDVSALLDAVDRERVAVLVAQIEFDKDMAQVAEFLAAVELENQRAAEAARAGSGTPSAGAGLRAVDVGGERSQAWWDAIQTCEGGGPQQWRTGYFGIEAGYPIGHLSYAEQLAWAKRIYAQHGASAWGCGDEAWAAVPGG